jgi:DNA polymerase III alpha subunit (gram-positive type)
MNTQETNIHITESNTRTWWNQLKKIQKGFKYIVALDLQTTGPDIMTDEIIQVGIIKLNARRRSWEEIKTIYKPSKPIPETAISIHRITNEMVQDQPKSTEALRLITEHCNAKVLVVAYKIHNNHFPLIWETYKRLHPNNIQNEFRPSLSIDLFNLWSTQFPESPFTNISIASCHRIFTGIRMLNDHSRGFQDSGLNAWACIKMLPAMFNYYKVPLGRSLLIEVDNEQSLPYIMTEKTMIIEVYANMYSNI